MQTANSFDAVTRKKILTGAGIALGGALLTYIGQLGLDYGQWTPVVTALLAIAINSVREYQKGAK